MQDNMQELTKMLIMTEQEVLNDRDAVDLLEQAISMITNGNSADKVIFKLNQNLNNYALVHDFRLPAELTELKVKLSENPNKWHGAGIAGAI